MPQVTGTFQSYKNNTMIVRHDGKANTTHTVAANATCTIKGQTSKLDDLEDGDSVSLSGDPVTSVSAQR